MVHKSQDLEATYHGEQKSLIIYSIACLNTLCPTGPPEINGLWRVHDNIGYTQVIVMTN